MYYEISEFHSYVEVRNFHLVFFPEMSPAASGIKINIDVNNFLYIET